MEIKQLEEVFNEAAFPEITFVYPKEYKFIKSALRAQGKHITISGPSGTGKSSLVEKLLRESSIDKTEILSLNGRSYSKHTSFISIVSIILGCTNSFESVTEELQKYKLILIDDFHHLSNDAREELGSFLKLWHEVNVRFLLVGIASSASELLGIDTELGIRNDPFEIKKQDNTFISELIKLGEESLNIKFSDNLKSEIISASNGVPSVAQVICRNACIETDIEKTITGSPLHVDMRLKDITESVLRIFHAKYFDKVVGLAKGKQQARSVHNTYFDIISEIAKEDSSEIPIELLYRKIVGTIDDSTQRSKKSTSFYNCLNNLDDVIRLRGLSDTLLYRQGASYISIEDPSFRFYLNLLDIELVRSKIHVRNSEYPYDVAVSFAGEVRTLVEQFVTSVKEKGLDVFYDFDQQAQLWGQDLDTKLADVYSNDALFMVVFISETYPIKDWTSFEFAVGKKAANKRTLEYILPIRIDETDIVGLKNTVGHLDLRVVSIQQAADFLDQKVNQYKSHTTE